MAQRLPASGSIIRPSPSSQFAMFPDARCDIKVVTGRAATGMAETDFHGTHAKTGRVVTASGAEVAEFAGDKIKELRDYHRVTSA